MIPLPSLKVAKVVGVLGVLAGAFYFTNNYITTKEQLAVTEAAYESATGAIQSYAETIASQNKRIDALNEGYQDARSQEADLQETILAHDLTELAEQKPNLIERRINDGTRWVLDAIAKATATLAEREARLPETR